MLIQELIQETIEIVTEENTDEVLTFLKSHGYEASKKTGVTIKVLVPRSQRLMAVHDIANLLPDSVIQDNGKQIKYDGKNILVKPSEAQHAGLAKESGAIEMINRVIASHSGDDTAAEIMVGNRQIRATLCHQVSGGWKADAVIVDEHGKETAWLSLKDGKSPRHFGQWGGLSHLARDPEVASFVADLKSRFPDGLTAKTPTLGRPIKSPRLKALTTFGKEFGQAPSKSNVDLILQGVPAIHEQGGKPILSGDHTWANGDIPEGDYEPILSVRYTSDRSDFGIKHARVTVYPKNGRKWQLFTSADAVQPESPEAVAPNDEPTPQPTPRPLGSV